MFAQILLITYSCICVTFIHNLPEIVHNQETRDLNLDPLLLAYETHICICQVSQYPVLECCTLDLVLITHYLTLI